MARKLIHGGAVRYHRHSEEFWRDLIDQWEQSGIGVRKFCEQNGVAPSTFHKRRADLAGRPASPPDATVSTPDACFIAVHPEPAQARGECAAPAAGPSAPPVRSQSRDCVVVTSGGVRIELTGGHADRVVRHLLSRLGGALC